MAFRTDLAIENKEIYDSKNKDKGIEISGVEIEKEKFCDEISITRIKITNEHGSRELSKPLGNYITLEVEGVVDGPEELKEKASSAVALELKRLVHFHNKLKVLVIGLGNDKVTPDSLGPYTVSKVKVTRHFFLMYDADGDDEMACVSGFIPGVMGSTGMETAELIQSAAAIAKPEVILAVDALAARNVDRISTTIQISDTGISPGAGTGNKRKELTKETMGIKVIAIGVPTVIDSRTLILDSLSGFLKDPAGAESYLEQNGQDMIVTSTDIDQVIKDFSDIISNGINITLHPGIYS
ncbi:GPR endopeptidase [Sinanaerobacter chloroacetimidivorans]|jgi:spore protease|uniref:Germination protease n=1 Tax=Sinanaerobacter chloroacetimidivorans TaxID=2818044 RepID=A0A8J8AZY9_9FIRM|nr:GPR endopeptidase [Sinanaerobacter chloroacetimidivorans]MBR0596317.1 GPR endopeptidase [Sinanaerobacter chloroacetimidivorans]